MKAARIATLLALALSGCVRTSGTVEIPPKDLPFPVARATSPAESSAPERTFAVFFVRSGRLLEARRKIEADAPAAEAALRALLEGPTKGEQSRGISTELSGEVRLLGVTITGNIARVDLSAEFEEPAPSDRIALRVAQVVWTLTALPLVHAVAFLIDGEPISVTTGDGAAVDRPVVRADYVPLAPSGAQTQAI